MKGLVIMERDKAQEFMPEVKDTLDRPLYEHEVFWSFNSDHHAEAFSDWWAVQGEDFFLDWLQENLASPDRKIDAENLDDAGEGG